ncbi:MAG TPA: ABC transporter ATP-binding protein [Steroidobacteraceae bacterium]|nr:ABC transporter ATP-binding protein [Steroidobacteraceae bacterium]
MSRLSIQALTKCYAGSVAVQDIDLDVAEGEFVSLLGPSGCGKTTTLRCVAGLEIPTSGRILFGDRDVTRLPPERRLIGMVFQNYALFPHMTIRENIGFGLEMRGVRDSDASKRISSVLDMVQLTGFDDRCPRQLSGGQQQRVALARALIVEPAVLLLDEPLANLDAKLRDEMRFFIRSLQQRIGITTLYVTHDQAESMTMSDRIVVMFTGRIHQAGAPQDIYDRPVTKDVAKFIGQANLIAGTVVHRCNGVATVDTTVGRLQCATNHAIEPGALTTAMVRPEAMQLVKECSTNAFSGRILERHFLGNIVDYRVVTADGTILAVQALGSIVHAAGEVVSVQIDPNKAWLLE